MNIFNTTVNVQASQVAQRQSISLPMWETQQTQAPSLGWEDPLEEEMATLSSILAWRIPWTGDCPMDWWATVHRVEKSLIGLND